MNLTKQQKLDILSKAIDEGADIDISFFDVSKDKAAVLTTEFAEMMGSVTEVKTYDNAYWYMTRIPKMKVVAFYEQPKQVEVLN